ncbi:MAG TPA: AAA family ATPase [Solirubrobacteraceae bacterium]|nr:AAA family ATPase [Solirubrobacteraceae bacterium]
MANRLRGRQVRLLLVYLVLHRQRLVGRQELIGALWPDYAPASEEAALRTLLSRVRSGMGADALAGRDELALSLPEPLWVDVEAANSELQRAAAALEQGDARTAWAVAQVPLNIAGRGLATGLQATWLDAARAELEETRLQALEVIGGAGLTMGGGQLASVERAGRALIEADLYRESGYVLLMQAAARRGNPAAAVRVFERLRGLMRDELGTTPSADAIAAYERLLEPAVTVAARPDSVPSRPSAGLELPAELQSVSPPELVGRRSELGELTTLWDQTRDGERPVPRPGGEASVRSRRVVVLAGDAGIGKTSLARSLARQAHGHGGVVLFGRAAEEGLAPYQPFLHALRHYLVLADLDEVGPAVREYGPELARLVPEIRRRVLDLPASPEAEPEGERYRLFEAVVGLLSAISERAPILLFLDDLHWADRPTLLLLRHLARAPGPTRLLILIAYRSEAPAEGLRDLLSDLSRENLLAQLDIGGLERHETTNLVRARAGQVPSRPLGAALYEASEGNPLFIEEIVRNLTQAGVEVGTASAAVLRDFALPEGVKRMIARRVDRLDPDTVQLLRMAAVVGREFDLSLLEQVAGRGEEELLEALEAALAAAVVIESPKEPGRYAFSHALIREALYEGMSASRRARIHRQVAAALEGRSASPGTLAYHFTRAASAEDAEKAIAYAIEAAAAATLLLAHEEAAEHYSRALEVLDRYQPEAERQRLELLLLFGEASVRAGERARVREVFFEAGALAEKLGDSARLARAAIGASRRYVPQPGVVDPELIAMLDRALELGSKEPSIERVNLLSRLSGALYYSPRRRQMGRLSQEAMRAAEALDDPVAEAHALAARRAALWDPSHLRERIESSTELLRLAHQIGDAELRLQSHAWLVVDLMEAGDRSGFEAQVEAFEQAAEDVREPFYWWQATLWKAMRALLTGQLDQAGNLAAEALAIGMPAEPVTAPQYYTSQMVTIRRQQDRGHELLAPAAQLVHQDPSQIGWRLTLAVLLLDAGRRDEAQAGLDLIAQRDLAGLPQDGHWLPTFAALGELASGLEDRWQARLVYDALLPYAEFNVVASHGGMCLGPVSRYLGKLAVALGERPRALEHFEQAITLSDRMRSPLWRANAQLDYAEALGERSVKGRQMRDEVTRTSAKLRLPAVAKRVQALDSV